LKTPLLDQLRRFYSKLDDRGSVIVEFAIVGPVFLLLLLSIFELGYMVYVQTVLDGAARDAARLVRTGQIQGSGTPTQQSTAFQTQLCNEMNAVAVSCSAMVFDIENFTNFSALATQMAKPITRDPKTGAMTNAAFQPGTASANVSVRVTYNRPFFTQWVGQMLSGHSSTNSAFLVSTVIFRNEPF
jgi:Flp pilus assembly protein TadG